MKYKTPSPAADPNPAALDTLEEPKQLYNFLDGFFLGKLKVFLQNLSDYTYKEDAISACFLPNGILNIFVIFFWNLKYAHKEVDRIFRLGLF